MIGERLGHVFDKPLRGLAERIRISPNSITVAGLIISLSASIVLVYDLLLGGILIIVGAAFDILDGVVARVNGKTSSFGAFLDSVLDRYSDAGMFLGVALNLDLNNNRVGALLSLLALSGAFLVSYTRSRAEGLGVDCKVGLMERPERVVLLTLGAVSGLIVPALWILVVLTHVTVAQRIWHVMRLTDRERT